MTTKRTSSISTIVMVLSAGVALSGHVPLKRAAPPPNNVATALPEILIVAGDIPADRRNAMLASAGKFYLFWNTGDETLLRQAISEHFVDHTLPPGRPQGPAGPAATSKAFLAAVLAELLEERAETYGRLITAEMGKPPPDSGPTRTQFPPAPPRMAPGTSGPNATSMSLN